MSASAHRAKDSQTRQEIERKTPRLQRSWVCLPTGLDFQKWRVLTQTSKVARLRRKPCVEKTLKVSDFGLSPNSRMHYRLFFYGEAPVLSFQRWARAQHSAFDAFKENIQVSHEMWQLVGRRSHDRRERFLTFVFCSFFLSLG